MSRVVIVKFRGGFYWLRIMDWEYNNWLKVEKESND